MSLFARLMYGALVWKERRRAQWAQRQHSGDKAGGCSAHIVTGKRGETLAYWYLRQAGYTLVARNRPSQWGAGELDLIGWDGPVLAFIEVKARHASEVGAPEDAVSHKQRRRIMKAAEAYLRRLATRPESYRFDVVSVSWDPEAGCQVRLIKDAFRG
jgi:putative endonuclease